MRKFFVYLLLLSTSFLNATVYTGTCGKNLSWTLNMEDSILVITGEGDMTDYRSWSDVPWVKKLHNSFPMKRCYLPAGISKISPYSFYYCTWLDSIYVDKDNPYFCDIDGVLYTKDTTALLTHPSNRDYSTYDIPNTVTTIGQGAFYAFSNCDIKTLTIPNSVTTISSGAFYDNLHMTSVIIGDGVTSIGESAFSSNSELKEITIGKSVEYIGDYAFSGYSNNLRKIKCNAINPPSMGEQVFYNRDCSNIKLYVLQESIPLYSIADQWKEFNIQDSSQLSEGVENLKVNHSYLGQKAIYNGQIFILRGDHTYTITGQEIK